MILLDFLLVTTPARAFERGCQIGGTYKCGSCGCKSSCMDDLAHSLRCTWWFLTDLQSLVLAGMFGGTPGAMKPFLSLGTSQLQQELLQKSIF